MSEARLRESCARFNQQKMPKIHAERSVHSNLPSLIGLSHRIHSHPEVAHEEVKASRWLGELLAQSGFAVKVGLCGLPTALSARRGTGDLHIVLCAEYDALPRIGHACGHNIIAAAAAGAAIALGDLADDLGITITVMGTPAEEVGDGGGKILLLERGAFVGVHAAMMIHPAPFDSVKLNYLAASTFEVEYFGRSSHPAAPHLGINAADALTVAQTAIALLRQHVQVTDGIQGIVTNGGDAPNIIPAYTSSRYTIRSKSIQAIEKLAPRVHACFKAGAIATGCALRISGGNKPYAEMHNDEDLVRIYKCNAESFGRRFVDNAPMTAHAGASTDMGNVSCEIPSIHPCIGIDSLPAVNHQPEFAARCVTASADKAVRDGALIMAWTVVDIALDQAIRKRLLTFRPESVSDRRSQPKISSD